MPVPAHRSVMSHYSAEIGRHPRLTTEDERRLAQLIEEGHHAAELIDEGVEHMTNRTKLAQEMDLPPAIEQPNVFPLSWHQGTQKMEEIWEASRREVLSRLNREIGDQGQALPQ